jgi:AAA+ ATPase superfamily predicted ATPase
MNIQIMMLNNVIIITIKVIPPSYIGNNSQFSLSRFSPLFFMMIKKKYKAVFLSQLFLFGSVLKIFSYLLNSV